MNTKATTLGDVEADVKQALSGAEEMLSQAASSTGERAAELRAKALAQLKALRERVQDAQATAVRQGRAAAHATDDYVHDHPWRAIATAAAAGVIIGLLIGRR
jgi:ElaB/YqjD/DUF883 family membrane-anchored ribosome-binding protein